MVTLDALASCPEPADWALTNSSVGIDDLTSWAALALLVLGVIILATWARHTWVSVEYRSIGRAVNAFPYLKVVYLVGGTAQALLGIEIEVSRMVTLEALATCPECIGWALAHSRWVGYLSIIAGPARLIARIIVSVIWAFHTVLPIVNGCSCWAIHTLADLKVVDLVDRATQTLFGV